MEKNKTQQFARFFIKDNRLNLSKNIRSKSKLDEPITKSKFYIYTT